VIEPTDDQIRSLLERARRIAVVGLSTDQSRPSYEVAAYLQSVGYTILPVNPKHEGMSILGEPVVARVTELEGPIDIVDLFRRAIDTPRPVDDAIAAGAGAIWMQLGIRNDEVGQRAADAGLFVVMNRCIAMEHRRLIGARRDRVGVSET
jgi:uncharacterized protein